jgi:serine/threonine protein kinase
MFSFNSLVFEEQVGGGAFADVIMARDASTNELYAVKMISKCKSQADNIAREVEAGRKLQHENIVQFICHHEDSDYDYLVFELIHGLDFFTYFDRFREFEEYSEWEARRLFRQMVDAVNYCHDQGVVHLDIKLDSILPKETSVVKTTRRPRIGEIYWKINVASVAHTVVKQH